jgi:hypothetical protein
VVRFANLLRCCGPPRAWDFGLRAQVERSEADWRKCGSCGGGADEWHSLKERSTTKTLDLLCFSSIPGVVGGPNFLMLVPFVGRTEAR